MEEDQDQPEWAVGPEDEYDALNDETFGDAGEGVQIYKQCKK